ncbi:MAG: hypothetical protein HY646_16815 [Acidobacteria bacterium]|nr:hypothetical protein [Acidobacteriota bacterium]
MIEKTIQTFLVNVVVFAFGVLTSIVVNRLLGPTLLGQYLLVTTTATIIVNIVNLGVNA